MKNISLYNKYRPKNFKTIIGQDTIKTLLLNSLKTNKFIQSYIFFGPHGTGKTSLARIYGKGINCKNFDGNDVCDHCECCTLINEHKTLDIVEIDAASNNGVEFIRELVSSTEYLPINLNKKIYIIDEAHGLSSQSWNSLLKVIEEPPSHIVFMFLTTQENKILPTIMSRCQKLKFSFLNSRSLNELTNSIAQQESKKIDPDVVHKVGNLSQGSARELLTILDKLFLQENDTITLQDYRNAFSFISDEKVLDFVEMLLSAKKAESFSFIDEFYASGCNLINLMEETFQILLELEMFRITQNTKILKKISAAETDRFKPHEHEYLKCCNAVQNSWKLLDANKNHVLQIKSFLVLFFAQKNDTFNDSKIKNIMPKQDMTYRTPLHKDTPTIIPSPKLEPQKHTEHQPEINLIQKKFKADLKPEHNIDPQPLPETKTSDHTFTFNTISIHPNNINKYLSGFKPKTFDTDYLEIIYTLQECAKHKEMSKKIYQHLLNHLNNHHELRNLFTSWNQKYEVIASDRTIVVAFDEANFTKIFNKRKSEPEIKAMLQKAINYENKSTITTEYSWYAIQSSKLLEYKQKSKNTTLPKTDEKPREKNETFNKWINSLEK